MADQCELDDRKLKNICNMVCIREDLGCSEGLARLCVQLYCTVWYKYPLL